MAIQTVLSSNTFNQFRATTNLVIDEINTHYDGTANLVIRSANTTFANINNLTVYGDAAIQGGDITTNSTSFTLANTDATTLSLGGAATSVLIGATTGNTTIRSANTVLDGDLFVNGGDILSTQTTFTLANTTATSLNIGGAATSLLLGATTGTATIRNASTVLDGDLAVNGGDVTTSATTFNIANTTATTLSVGGAATSLLIGATTGTATIRNASTVITGDLAVNGGDVTTSATTFNLLNTTATTLNLGGDATSLTIGATTGNTTIRNAGTVITGDLFVSGGDIVGTTLSLNLANVTTTTLELGGAATINMGSTGGTTNIRSTALNLTGDLAVNGGDVTTSATTFNLLNTTATTLNVGGAATTVSIGAATGNTTINNANTIISGDLFVNGGDILSTQSTFTLANNTATTLELGGAANVNIGSTTGNTLIRSANTVLTGDLFVNGGDILSTQTTFNVANTTATSVRLGGAATDLMIGATTGTTTIRNATTVITGDLTVSGGDIVGTASLNLANVTTTTLELGGAATINMGSTTGNTLIRSANTVLTGDLFVNGGDILSTQTTFNVANTTATTLGIGGGATSVLIGASTGTATIRNANVVVTGTLTARYATKVANTATATSLTPDVSVNNQYSYTALGTALTINAPTGTPLDADRLTFRIKDNGTTRVLTWNAIYRIVGTVLPTSTTASKLIYVGCIYNAADTKWDVIAIARES